MKAGVSKGPWEVVTRPTRADWSRAETSKHRDISNDSMGSNDGWHGQRCSDACAVSSRSGCAGRPAKPDLRTLRGEARLLLLEALLVPFLFVDDQAIDECGGFIGFEFALFFQKWRGDDEFVIGEPLAGMAGAGWVFEDGDRPLFAVDLGRARQDVEGL